MGQDEVEEIDYTPRSRPRLRELPLEPVRGLASVRGQAAGPGALVFPVFEYTHAGGNCTVIGGSVYHGKARLALRGRYILGDYCSGNVWSFEIRGGQAKSVRRERFRIAGLTSFGEDAAGELYAVDSSVLYRLT